MWLKKLFRWVKKLLTGTVKEVAKEIDLCEIAELYLLTNPKISEADKQIIRRAIIDIKDMGITEAIKKQAIRKLEEILAKYDMRGYLNPDPRD